ncbi:transporter [Sulfurimicrobium lacus]|uniref:transporter n=1 Tax=Sulfurimicrobium lacus TaxID=2715678 RepID=UPI0015646A4E|nr:transporter [Sulfurimicrobium lacus]
MFANSRRLAGAGLCLGMLAATGVMAGAQAEQQDVEATPYRPTVSNPADLSAPGWLEMEMGWQRVRGGGDQRRDSFPVLAKLAFSEDWGVLLGSELGIRRTDWDNNSFTGSGDTTVLLKHRIAGSGEGSAWGVEAGFKSPTAKDTLGSGKADYLVNAIYSRDFAANHFDLNLNAAYIGAIDASEGRTQYGWAAALSHSLDARWGVFGELSGYTRRGTAATEQFMAGASYNYSKRVVFDIGGAWGLNDASPDGTVFAGLTVLLGRLW